MRNYQVLGRPPYRFRAGDPYASALYLKIVPVDGQTLRILAAPASRVVDRLLLFEKTLELDVTVRHRRANMKEVPETASNLSEISLEIKS